MILSALLLAEEEEIFDPNIVTPGAVGFVITFMVALAAIALIFDMVRRLRRVRYREEIDAKLQAELEARREQESGEAQS